MCRLRYVFEKGIVLGSLNCLQVKMQLLEEHRVRIMTKELDLLYQATIAFYAGNSTQLQVGNFESVH